MESNDQTAQMLLLVLVGAIVILAILVVIYILLKMKDSSSKVDKNKKEESLENSKDRKEQSRNTSKQSVFDFMEFDKVEDNMIVQQKGKKYLMVIECQGVNYDLMSGVEKTGVEEGFIQFLNTLRYPIQIYIQTRTVNLENSINTYKSKVAEIETRLFRMRQEYNSMVNNEEYTENTAEKDKLFYELTKLNNLYEYGRDVIYNTEKMSLNKNILNKKYYIVLSYYAADEMDTSNMHENEIQTNAFSELYTRCQSIMRAISVCSVSSKILNSTELSELLYVAYNRDDSEIFDIKKAKQIGYDSEYSTAPDVLEKRMKELDKVIEKQAVEIAKQSVDKVKSKKRKALEEKEANIKDLADEMAQIILKQNKEYLGKEVVDQAIEEVKKGIQKDKGGNGDVKKKKTTKTTRSSSK